MNHCRSILLAVVTGVCLFWGTTGAALCGDDGAVWKIGTLAPEKAGWALHADKYIVKSVIQMTNGRIHPVVYWGGTMGDDEDYLDKMRSGKLQGAGLSGQGASLACPEFSVVQLPFLFRNYEEVDYIRERMFSRFDALFAQYGLKLLYWLDQDFDQVFSGSETTASLADFRKKRFALWSGPVEEAFFEAIDAKFVAMNVPEAVNAWRKGSVDAAIAPATWMIATGLLPSIRCINTVKIRYSPVVVVITTDAWNSLLPADRESQEKNRDDTTRKFNAEVRRDNLESIKTVINAGVKEAVMTPADFEELRQRSIKVYAHLSGILYPEDLLREVEDHLKTYRASH